MSKRFDHELEKAMDSAVMTLSRAFFHTGHNSKPVIMHAIRVGMALFDRGYSREIVLAGLLHDILEDTGLPPETLQAQFGSHITDIVRAATFDREISDKRAQNRDMFLRCRELGFDALVVKCADIWDTIDYFVPTPGYEELDRVLLGKYQDFLCIAEGILDDEPIFAELREKVHHVQLWMDEFENT